MQGPEADLITVGPEVFKAAAEKVFERSKHLDRSALKPFRPEGLSREELQV